MPLWTPRLLNTSHDREGRSWLGLLNHWGQFMHGQPLSLDLSAIAATCYQLFGWTPDRQIDPSVHLAAIQHANYPLFPRAAAFLSRFGGLSTLSVVRTAGANSIYYHQAIPYMFDRNRLFEDFIPANAQHCDSETAPDWREHPFIKRHQRQICPIGSYDNDATIFLTDDGWVLLGKFYGIPTHRNRQPMMSIVGTSLSDGLNRLVDRAVCYYHRTEERG
ncbi:SUKH-3 domain-containing protein [Herpetosiphon giganteus]|uniref:SUKH-3 domain-containing protein n=1 Tax=Herpetosiphon giganteus TaxID=2029754 RepID=UPI003B83120B